MNFGEIVFSISGSIFSLAVNEFNTGQEIANFHFLLLIIVYNTSMLSLMINIILSLTAREQRENLNLPVK